jgi:hypothetical protein
VSARKENQVAESKRDMFEARTVAGKHDVYLYGILVATGETEWWAQHIAERLNGTWARP